jgi:hypothetical protein
MNFAVECTSEGVTFSRCQPPNYTFRSMPRSQSANAPATNVEGVRVISRPRQAKKETKRLRKRVVEKSDGRYLIYFEKG